MSRTRRLLCAGLLALAVRPEGGAAQAGPDRACRSCHGEVEFLRQRTPVRAEALSLHVDVVALQGSAHTGMSCTECHQSFDPYPHRPRASTETCGSCHSDAEALWSQGAHAVPEELGGASAECSACHGVHDVGFVSDSLGPVDVAALNANCLGCHTDRVLPPNDPHADDAVSCAGCHAPHDTHAVDDTRSWLAPLNQAAQGCAGCHEEEVADVRTDAHFAALHSEQATAPEASEATSEETSEETSADAEALHGPPTCTTCHGGHELAGPTTEPAPMDQSAVCGACHEEFVESFADSYHGQATALGSTVAATCSDCHTGHLVHPADEARSTVADESLVDTCATCHEGASASFVQFQPHANHHDRERYPYVWWSYRLMTGLLIGVFGVFGLHTGLWVVRLAMTSEHAPPTGSDR